MVLLHWRGHWERNCNHPDDIASSARRPVVPGASSASLAQVCAFRRARPADVGPSLGPTARLESRNGLNPVIIGWKQRGNLFDD
jgi:hypothetical protein